jgi:hypothetical protein
MVKLSLIICVILILYLIYCIKCEHFEFFEQEDEYTKNLAEQVRHIDPRIDAIIDKLKFFDGNNRSYTIDKTYVHLCKIDGKGEMYNKAALTYVLLHEIAHTLCPEEQHTDLFHDIFDDLIIKAKQHGIPVEKPVQNYCKW